MLVQILIHFFSKKEQALMLVLHHLFSQKWNASSPNICFKVRELSFIVSSKFCNGYLLHVVFLWECTMVHCNWINIILYWFYINNERKEALIKKKTYAGQKLEKGQAEALENYDPNAPLHERLLIKHRRILGFIIPIIFWQTIWWILAIKVSWMYLNAFSNQQYFLLFLSCKLALSLLI